MKLKSVPRWLVAIIVLAAIAFVIVLIIAGGRRGQTKEEEEFIPKAVRVTTRKGQIVVTISKAEQERNGIVTSWLTPVSQRAEVRAYGTVVDLQELIDNRNSYAMAKAKVDETQANLTASKKEYKRLKKLFQPNRNVSEKSLQAAEAVWRSDKAAAGASQVALKAQEAGISQRWGVVIAGWLFKSTPDFERLASQQDLLLQLTLPPGTAVLSTPETALVSRDGKKILAMLVSEAPRTDPRIQGVTYFYVAPKETSGLLPQMNIYAYLPVGPEVSGVIVPASAVVWLDGKAWVYVQEDRDQFVRREISTDAPVKEGWFITTLAPGERVVTAGAQLLLSEEFRSKIQIQG